MTAHFSTVQFHDQALLVTSQNGLLLTAVKPICENIGIQWHAQRKRIQRDTVLSEGASMMDSPSNGGVQQVLCLPLNYLNGWLFGIDDSRIKDPEVRKRVIEYKKECYQVLFDYWQNGIAVNPRMPITDEEFGALSSLIEGKASVLPAKSRRSAQHRIWNQVHRAFNVKSGHDLTEEQLPEARNFIAAYEIEGEYIPATKALDRSYTTDAETALMFSRVACHRWNDLEQLTKQHDLILRKQRQCGNQKELLEAQESFNQRIFKLCSDLYDPIHEASYRLRKLACVELDQRKVDSYIDMQDTIRVY